MGTLYVDSNAVGLNDGTSWTDAWVDIQSAWGAWVAGDICWVASNHSQTQATEELFAADTMSHTDPFVMYSVDSSDDSYTPATAAQIAVTGANIDIDVNDSMHAYGIFFQMVDGDFDGSATSQSFRFEDCNFKWTGTLAIRSFWFFSVACINCTFDNTAGSNGYNINPGTAMFHGCTFKGRSTTIGHFTESPRGSHEPSTHVVGCDLSGLTNMSNNLNTISSSVEFVGCKFASGDTIRAPSQGLEYSAHISASTLDGASTAKNYEAIVTLAAGIMTVDTAIYRDDGWQDEDGSTRLSHKMSTQTYLKGPHTPMRGVDLFAYVDSTGSKTFTIYGVEDFTTSPTEDEAWIDVSYLGTTNSVHWSMAGGRSIFSVTSIATDTKAWTGAAGKTKVKFAETVTINKVGTYMVRVHLAKFESGKALWYDPLVEVV